MTHDPVRIGTRGSALALYQANLVKDLLRERCGLACELVILKTAGDVDQSRPVAELGQVGVFVKELERALLADEVDLAVHSLKDLPTDLPPGLVLAAQPERVDVHDLLLVHPDAWDDAAEAVPLRHGARVGTSSLRRRVQLLEVRPDLVLVPVRGNVPTRADKARTGELEAVVLAAAGVGRLGIDLGALRPFSLPPDRFVPAPGQAALGLEARADDARLLEALAALHDPEVAMATAAERQLLHGLGAGCSVPLGAHALPGADGRLLLRAVLGPAGAHPRPRLRRALVRAGDPQAAAELALRVLDPPAAPLQGEALRGKRVLLLRDPARGDELVEALEALGAEARCRAATEPRALAAPEQVRAAVRDLPRGSWVLLASPQAAQCFAAALDEPARAALFHLHLGAVGPGTARELAEAELPVDLLAGRADGAGLAEELLQRQGPRPPAVLLPAARLGRAELEQALAAAGVRVERLALYATEPCAPLQADDLEGVDAVVLFAPSAARAALGELALPAGCALVAIGPTTAAELSHLGRPVREVAETPTPAGILAALGRVFARA